MILWLITKRSRGAKVSAFGKHKHSNWQVAMAPAQTWPWLKQLSRQPGDSPGWRWARTRRGPKRADCSRGPPRLSGLPRIGRGVGSLYLGRSPPACTSLARRRKHAFRALKEPSDKDVSPARDIQTFPYISVPIPHNTTVILTPSIQ